MLGIKVKQLIWALFSMMLANIVFGGGGGHNMLMVVNPKDENSLRIANLYQQLRNVPDRNILFIEPAMLSNGQVDRIINEQQFRDRYVTPFSQALTDRGISDQVDYIGTLGQPHRVRGRLLGRLRGGRLPADGHPAF